MKEKVSLRKSSMPIKTHWLEIEKEGSKLFVSLRSTKGLIGDRASIKPVVLENLATMLPGVILKNGPLRFYRVDDEMRVSFDELEPGLHGYDEIDDKQFVAAVSKVLGKDLATKQKAETKVAAKSPVKAKGAVKATQSKSSSKSHGVRPSRAKPTAKAKPKSKPVRKAKKK